MALSHRPDHRHLHRRSNGLSSVVHQRTTDVPIWGLRLWLRQPYLGLGAVIAARKDNRMDYAIIGLGARATGSAARTEA